MEETGLAVLETILSYITINPGARQTGGMLSPHGGAGTSVRIIQVKWFAM
jgi:hypothetical protein